MFNKKATARHEANNSYSAALILRNRASQPLVMVAWAEAFQQRQRAERATTSALTQRRLRLQGVTYANA